MKTFEAQMLERLPHHISSRGWEFVRRDSRTIVARGATRHIAIYRRPFDPGVDDERLSTVVDGYVRVSTSARMSLSWWDAWQHALEAMEYIDRKRKAA